MLDYDHFDTSQLPQSIKYKTVPFRNATVVPLGITLIEFPEIFNMKLV